MTFHAWSDEENPPPPATPLLSLFSFYLISFIGIFHSSFSKIYTINTQPWNIIVFIFSSWEVSFLPDPRQKHLFSNMFWKCLPPAPMNVATAYLCIQHKVIYLSGWAARSSEAGTWLHTAVHSFECHLCHSLAVWPRTYT